MFIINIKRHHFLDAFVEYVVVVYFLDACANSGVLTLPVESTRVVLFSDCWF